MLYSTLIVTHILVSVSMVLLILLQRGKGAEAGAAFGAGASGTVFGAQGSASFLSRATAVLATLFFVNSLALAFLAGRQEGPVSLMEQIGETPAGPVEVLPAPDVAVDPDLLDLPALPEPTREAPEADGDDADGS